MKLYETKSFVTDPETNQAVDYREYSSSASDASKVRTRLKATKVHLEIKTEEVEIDTTRSGIITFLNTRMAHESWAAPAVADKLKG